uniref:Uncharacterized protein n=1 Tax=Anguilla anguilla TaxID=7936 RepID=A0A0E9U9X1_ANGAN
MLLPDEEHSIKTSFISSTEKKANYCVTLIDYVFHKYLMFGLRSNYF